MKIEIDLNDILHNGEQGETVRDSIIRQITHTLSEGAEDRINKAIDLEVSKTINNALKEYCEKQLPVLFDAFMDVEFNEVDQWGSKTKETTTVRKQLIKRICKEFIFDNSNRYGSDKNYFSGRIDTLVRESIDKWSSEFRKNIDENMKQVALGQAVKILQEKLGLK